MPNNPQKFNQRQVDAILPPIGPSEIPANLANPAGPASSILSRRPRLKRPQLAQVPPVSQLANQMTVNPPEVAEHDTVIDDCMRSVTVDDVISGALVDVYVNGVWRGAAFAPSSGIINNATALPGKTIGAVVTNPNSNFQSNSGGSIDFSTGLVHVEVPLAICSLKVGDLVQATQTVGKTQSAMSAPVAVVSHIPYSVLTQHYNSARTGWYPYAGLSWYNQDATIKGVKQLKELPLLTVPNVTANNPSLQFSYPVDGKVYAQPLYMHHQYFPGLGQHNVIFLATENDSVYAFDADSTDAKNNPILLWHSALLPAGHRALRSPEENIGRSDDIVPLIGISSTPVIACGCGCSCECEGSTEDHNCGCCTTGTMYVVAKSIRDSDLTQHIFLHALDVTTGLDRPNSPVEITGSIINSTGATVAFTPSIENNRAGLLLLNGRIYIGFASHGDANKDGVAYHGWIASYDANTLKQTGLFCTTPNGVYDPLQADSPQIAKGGVWQSGQGLSTDGSAIYCSTGNGTFDAKAGSGVNNDYGDCVLKLSTDLKVLSWFADFDNPDFNGGGDFDQGSGGVMVIPSPQSGNTPNLVVTCGKTGTVLLLNQKALGGFVAANAGAISTFHFTQTTYVGFLGGPAYYLDGKGQPYILFCTDLGPLASFALQNGQLLYAADTGKIIYSLGGATPVVSSNPQDPSSGLIWLIDRQAGTNVDFKDMMITNNTLNLVCYDAASFSIAGKPILIRSIPFGSKSGVWTGPGAARALIVPTVINGRIYSAYVDPTNDQYYVGVFY